MPEGAASKSAANTSNAVAATPPDNPAATLITRDLVNPEHGAGLPSSGYNSVQVASTPTVALCVTPESSYWEKVLPTLPSIVTSIIAIFLSVYALIYNKRKDERVRLQSIKDDFWIRKVISPVSIEPFLKDVTELASSLPTAKSNLTIDELKVRWTNETSKFEEYRSRYDVLNIVDSAVAQKVAYELDQFYDDLAEYFGALCGYRDNKIEVPPDTQVYSRKFLGTRISISRCILEYQSTLHF